MLRYNKTRAPGNSSHIAHAMVVGMHSLCCGVPAALALFGVALGAVAGGGAVLKAHAWLHGYEGHLLGVSFALVVAGGLAEWRRRKEWRGFPKLYALSLACFLLNGAIVAEHRIPPAAAIALAAPR